MEYFTRRFRGAWVGVWYEVSDDEEAIWIVNMVVGDHVVSMDGLAALGSGSVIAGINRSVDRALQWACEMDESLSCTDRFACRSANGEEVMEK